ncbi:hypothetical protein [Silicimonas algicola]|uniref:Uncharacterized protein n=1 Tax=Silicimonas algicola TaxID=1826607 RepID=A0A316FX00_9RHOB|nr:hypothetical protein [Silicimonas algicola]PWK53108.1 hypothetical protein C8D95_11410 [Silicimonas algicola]
MSGNATDPKVEDVLSSVRRLVSGELPRTPRPALPEGPGALVLTAAQRIVTAPRGATSATARKSLEERIAELEAAVSFRNDEFEPDGSEDQSQHRPDRIVYTRPPSETPDTSRRRSSLRLSQIALIETGPAADDEEIGTETPAFRRKSDTNANDQAAVDDEEAPMAEDVQPAPHTAEVRRFTDPDDVATRLAARWSGDPTRASAPVMPTTLARDGDDFDDALSRAVRESVRSLVAEDRLVEAPETTDETSGVPVDMSAEDFDDEPSAFSRFSRDERDDNDADRIADTQDDDPEIDALIAEAEAPEPSVIFVHKDQDEESGREPDEPVDDEYESRADAAGPDVTRGEEVRTAPPFDAAIEPALAATTTRAAVPVEDAVAPEDGAIETVSPSPLDVAGAALAVLPNEDAMRLMVGRLIREELQGELGERITRNVRKLVRREILRALNARDLT